MSETTLILLRRYVLSLNISLDYQKYLFGLNKIIIDLNLTLNTLYMPHLTFVDPRINIGCVRDRFVFIHIEHIIFT